MSYTQQARADAEARLVAREAEDDEGRRPAGSRHPPVQGRDVSRRSKVSRNGVPGSAPDVRERRCGYCYRPAPEAATKRWQFCNDTCRKAHSRGQSRWTAAERATRNVWTDPVWNHVLNWFIGQHKALIADTVSRWMSARNALLPSEWQDVSPTVRGRLILGRSQDVVLDVVWMKLAEVVHEFSGPGVDYSTEALIGRKIEGVIVHRLRIALSDARRASPEFVRRREGNERWLERVEIEHDPLILDDPSVFLEDEPDRRGASKKALDAILRPIFGRPSVEEEAVKHVGNQRYADSLDLTERRVWQVLRAAETAPDTLAQIMGPGITPEHAAGKIDEWRRDPVETAAWAIRRILSAFSDELPADARHLEQLAHEKATSWLPAGFRDTERIGPVLGGASQVGGSGRPVMRCGGISG